MNYDYPNECSTEKGCLNLYFCRRDYALSLNGTLALNTLLLLLLIILLNTIKWLATREHTFSIIMEYVRFAFAFFLF